MIAAKEIHISEVRQCRVSCLKKNNDRFMDEIIRKFPGIIEKPKDIEAWNPGERLFDATDKVFFFCLATDAHEDDRVSDELHFAIKAGWLTMVVFDFGGEFIWMTRDMYIEAFNNRGESDW